MRIGIHGEKLFEAFEVADKVFMYRPPNVNWDVSDSATNFIVHNSVNTLLDNLVQEVRNGDSVLIMSNGGFDNLQKRLVAALDNN